MLRSSSIIAGNGTYDAHNKGGTINGLDTAFKFGFMKATTKHFLWGVEGSVGYAAGAKSTTSSVGTTNVAKPALNTPDGFTLKSKITRGITTDVVSKLGAKFNKTSVYGIVGIAFTPFKHNIDTTFQVSNVYSNNNTNSTRITRSNSRNRLLTGVTFGAGVMQDLNDKFSVKIEYRHTIYEISHNRVSGNCLWVNSKIAPETDAIMGGVVYHL